MKNFEDGKKVRFALRSNSLLIFVLEEGEGG